MDDGKFHKVANVVGSTMKYHPHGDQSIYAALVNLANKDVFIDKQGNFGNSYTGDGASAARYIECRLTPLAKESLFNAEITEFEESYDGRNKEPIHLPAKIPVLLLHGAEGIAVGMSTKILPHNFNELLDAQIRHLRGQKFHLFPDFYQGGTIDVSGYEDGLGKIKVQARIEVTDPKTLTIRELPAGQTTEGLISSIEDAVQKGKVKVSSINDFTTDQVEIEIKLPRGANPDVTLQTLYAFTNCESSISCNCLVIQENRPVVVTVSDVLRHNTERLVDHLRRELEIELGKLEDKFHAKTLEQIFIENRIYKRIEECTTQEAIFSEVYAGLEPFRHMLNRDVVDEDIERLLRIPIRRISLFDMNRNKQELDDILARMDEIRHHLANIVDFTIAFIKDVKSRYGRYYPRCSRIKQLDAVDVKEIALANVKVGHDRGNGFIGTAVKTDEPILCTEFDRLVVLKSDGTYRVIPIPDKEYVGRVFAVLRSDKEQVYGIIYRDKKSKKCYVKQFCIGSYIMNKDYRCIPKNAKIEKMFDRYGVVIRCEFAPAKGQRINHVDVDFETEEVPLRSASARGVLVGTKPVDKILVLKRGSEVRPEEAGDGSVTFAEDDVDSGPKIKYPQPKDDSYAKLPSLRIAELAAEDAEKAERKRKRKKKADPKAPDTNAAKAKSGARDSVEQKPKSKAKKAAPKSDGPKPNTRLKGGGRNLIDNDDFQLE
jgi:topoisomerase-4 subunit A